MGLTEVMVEDTLPIGEEEFHPCGEKERGTHHDLSKPMETPKVNLLYIELTIQFKHYLT